MKVAEICENDGVRNILVSSISTYRNDTTNKVTQATNCVFDKSNYKLLIFVRFKLRVVNFTSY